MFLKLRFLLKHSFREFLGAELLRDGNYDTITSGQQFYDGADLSLLVPDTDAEVLAEGGYLPGQIWQSLFTNWVYEDAPALNPSVVLRLWPNAFRASGVYIDGAFRLENDPVYPHSIDYLNGRVIFDNPITDFIKPIHADFTYKTVKILSLREFNNQLKFGLLEQQYKTNPFTAGQLVYPSGTTKIAPLPIIFIEDMGRTFGNYQLGDRSLIARDELVCEIWALDESTRDNLIDLISYQQRKSFSIINYNIVPFPLSGLKNELSPNFIPYISLAQNEPLPGPSFSGINPVAFRGFIEETEVADLDSFFSDSNTQQDVFERAIVRMSVETYPIMPTTPFGFDISLEGIDGRNMEN